MYTEDDKLRAMCSRDGASEMRSAVSWSRISAQEPGAAVRSFTRLVDRPSKRQCGARMQRSRSPIVCLAGWLTSKRQDRPGCDRAGRSLRQHRILVQVIGCKPERPAPPIQTLERNPAARLQVFAGPRALSPVGRTRLLSRVALGSRAGAGVGRRAWACGPWVPDISLTAKFRDDSERAYTVSFRLSARGGRPPA